ncbi:hypothetical protein [Endozoicomonas sp. YOMI1]|uniref:hypothetical protein n=1 Tax=Endozoicomonas sp. YOMI1 TaxID=2828739 RepID=UPI002147293F|nr:hypothetical protein [Endozoicomonas sp. YOMI1]
MNIGNMATGLAGVGLTAAVSLSTGVADSSILTKWQTRTVMALSSILGTSLSLVQCIREGRNVSARTMATLATNVCVLTYSNLQPWADFTQEFEIFKEADCFAEFMKKGEMSMPKCQPYLHKAEIKEMTLEHTIDDRSYKTWRKTWYSWKQ